VDYLTNTHFYTFLSKLFSDPSSEIESKSSENYQEIISSKLENDSGYFVIIEKIYKLLLTPQ
jgi:hypothetical protein